MKRNEGFSVWDRLPVGIVVTGIDQSTDPVVPVRRTGTVFHPRAWGTTKSVTTATPGWVEVGYWIVGFSAVGLPLMFATISVVDHLIGRR